MINRQKIRKGDLVMVISGESKGKQGRVTEVDRKNDKVFVEGVNMMTKHRKPSAKNPQGGIEKKEASIHISNVMLVDAKGTVTRIGRRKNSDGRLERYSKKSGEALK